MERMNDKKGGAKMNFFLTKTDKETKPKGLNDQAIYVRRGGSLAVFTPADVLQLQEYALDIKDIKLYDYLEKFWKQA